MCGSEETRPFQLTREALERFADGGATHPPLQNPGYGPEWHQQYIHIHGYTYQVLVRLLKTAQSTGAFCFFQSTRLFLFEMTVYI